MGVLKNKSMKTSSERRVASDGELKFLVSFLLLRNLLETYANIAFIESYFFIFLHNEHELHFIIHLKFRSDHVILNLLYFI